MVKEGTRSSERLAKRQDGKTATASGVMKSRHNTSSSCALDFEDEYSSGLPDGNYMFYTFPT